MFIIGCGVLGRRVAAEGLRRGANVVGLVHSEASVRRLRETGIEPLRADLDEASLPPLPSAGADLFYFAPPPDAGREDTRMQRVLGALQRDGLPRRVVYVSTTGVYGDCAGAWVDESRPVNPGADRAYRRLDAETRLRAWASEQGVEAVILRVAGIYGPERLPLARLRQGLPLVRAEEAPFTNRIHIDDLVRVCVAAMEKPVAGEVFNVSDGHPGTMADYFDAIADRAGLPRPPKIAMQEAAERLSPGMLSYMRESRRLDNGKMRRLLVERLEYDTLEAGLDACFPAPP